MTTTPYACALSPPGVPQSGTATALLFLALVIFVPPLADLFRFTALDAGGFFLCFGAAVFSIYRKNGTLDMHPDPVVGRKQSDAWLATEVPKILNSCVYQNGGVIFITWDEAEERNGDDPDQVPMIVISPKLISPGLKISTPLTHASYLATVEDLFGPAKTRCRSGGADTLGVLPFAEPHPIVLITTRNPYTGPPTLAEPLARAPAIGAADRISIAQLIEAFEVRYPERMICVGFIPPAVSGLAPRRAGRGS